LIARELVDSYDLNQMQIAKLLGITQPAVSNYLSLLRGEAEKAFDTTEVKEVARTMAKELTEGRLSMSQSIYTLCRLCIRLRSAGVTCSLHKEAVPELSAEECKVCQELFTKEAEPVSERVNTINNIRSAISKLSDSKEFLSIIPEVRTNLVMATTGAQSVSEVAGIPGRIIVARERLKTLSDPEFGASFHLASVLLAAREKNKSIRAAINVLFNEKIEKTMQILNMKVYKFNRASLPSEATDKNIAVAWAVRKATDELGKTPDAVVDEGGYGVEPATYIFGSSALDVADKSIRIARALSS
jgi:hypothetical protein